MCRATGSPMLDLRQLQQGMTAAILGGEEPTFLAAIDLERVPAEARLQIYRNHALITLTEALIATFPVVCRLVDRGFFAYAANAFVRKSPPTTPCLTEYGADFPDFLDGFPECRNEPYLGDVARLEWAVHRARCAETARPLPLSALSEIPRADMAKAILRLQPSWSAFTSRWRVDQIWQAHQPDARADSLQSIESGAATIEVYRLADTVTIASLDRARFWFRAALARRDPLGEAVDCAFAVDPMFDLPLVEAVRVSQMSEEPGLDTGCRNLRHRGKGDPHVAHLPLGVVFGQMRHLHRAAGHEYGFCGQLRRRALREKISQQAVEARLGKFVRVPKFAVRAEHRMVMHKVFHVGSKHEERTKGRHT